MKLTFLFVNELSKSEISTFANQRISSYDLHIKTMPTLFNVLAKGNAVYVTQQLKMKKKHFVLECVSLIVYRRF